MKTIIPLLMLSLLTACTSTPPLANDPRVNPQMLSTNDLIKAQIEKMEKLERDMEKREQEMKYQHLKELTQMQIQQKQQPAAAQGHANCKLLCF
jgi:hypothetical protein